MNSRWMLVLAKHKQAPIAQGHLVKENRTLSAVNTHLIRWFTHGGLPKLHQKIDVADTVNSNHFTDLLYQFARLTLLLTLIPEWISNRMPSKMPTSSQLEFANGFHFTIYNGCNPLSILGLKLFYVSKWGPWERCAELEIITITLIHPLTTVERQQFYVTAINAGHF